MNKRITEVIKKLRKRKGYIQMDIAEKLTARQGKHVASYTYSKIENGVHELTVPMLLDIAAVLEIPAGEIVNEITGYTEHKDKIERLQMRIASLVVKNHELEQKLFRALEDAK